MNKNTHSIQRVFLEIDTRSMTMADSIKNNLAVFLQNELFPIIEKQFNGIQNIENQIIQIEKLDISIQSDIHKNDTFLASNETKNDIKNRIEKEVQKTLNDLKKRDQSHVENEHENGTEWKTISPKDKEVKTLLYFIENGRMPWWITKEAEKNFLEKINLKNLKNNTFSIPFRQLIHQKNVQKRIINQFSNEQIVFFSSKSNEKTAVENNILLKILNKKSHDFKSSFWYSFFSVLADKKQSELIWFYIENEALFQSEKMVFEVYFLNLKTFGIPDFSDEELQKIKEDYLFFKKKNTTENTNLKIEKETRFSEENQTGIHLEKIENTTGISAETNSVKEKFNDESRDKSEEKNRTKEENISDLKPETKAVKEESKIPIEAKKLTAAEKIQLKSKTENPVIKDPSIIQNKDENNFKERNFEQNLQQNDPAFQSCYVQNAGLIILHPFLKEMLKKCKVMNENNTLSDKELAAHILHYAATQKESDYEYTMLFEKFLCGIPLQETIRRDIQVNEYQKLQVEEMLKSAVQHWKALKNTSTGVLRTEFLQREGKFDWSETNPKLSIERKTQDLLLEKIPWNISVVKIPWIEKLIYTQW
ncbi:contractile injection system tape measure protein [Flavobacterium gelatinilyticum]|uniref:contractile injection system tape measure protein n=1 Tax=Flavobacterium gelatinilyticum TaxID=3003260 RepID=UPI002480AD92|nr:contractile injection system tape measure protein [Flavobacterium gelatinilyticum]